jgi:hypothetical protein
LIEPDKVTCANDDVRDNHQDCKKRDRQRIAAMSGRFRVSETHGTPVAIRPCALRTRRMPDTPDR